MAQEIKMSASGLKAMQDELEYLKTVRRKELAEEIKEARSHGDLSENSEYDEAKNTQGLVENRITELEQMVKNAVVIDESELSVENVSVGTHVTIQMEGEDEVEEYDIVGRTEADPLNGNGAFSRHEAGGGGGKVEVKFPALSQVFETHHSRNQVHVACDDMPLESSRGRHGPLEVDPVTGFDASQDGILRSFRHHLCRETPSFTHHHGKAHARYGD